MPSNIVTPTAPRQVTVTSGLSVAKKPWLKVQDNGLGMEVRKDADPIFQLFDRQHQHISGTGVGLYLVQRIVHSRGGHLDVLVP